MLENPEIILGSLGSERQVPEHDFIIYTQNYNNWNYKNKIKMTYPVSWGVEVSPDTNPTSTQMSPLGFGVREYLYLVSILIVLSVIAYRFSYLIMA